MSSVNANLPILAASANYEADDWGRVEGGGSLDVRAEAELKRGFDLELGAEALVAIDASVAKFLTADLHGQANAAARVKAQVQVPLDLFTEAGVAIRLQAIAEAAASIELAMGLKAGDFLALAEADPRMRGVGLRLLSALLAEAKISGGVRAKAAASAMAYANVALTGTLLASPGAKAGFTVAAEAGLGLKAGAGYRVFATFGLDQPNRLVRRCTDILVDEVIDRVGERLSTPTERALLDELRTPAKIAIRTCYELGAELGRNPNFVGARADVVAQRCAEVALEEAQRYLLDRLADMGFSQFQAAFRALNYTEHTWDAAQPERFALADRLTAGPEDPFEPSASTLAFWTGVVNDAVSLAEALGGQRNAGQAWLEPLSIMWAATQLAFVAVQRISDSGARASLFTTSADTAFPPFKNAALATAPGPVKEHICKTLRPGAAVTEPTAEDLVAFLLRRTVVDQLVQHAPAIQPVLNLVGTAAPVDAMTTIMSHVGGFVAAGGGNVSPTQSIDLILAGLQQYVSNRLQVELDPVLRSALADGDPELQYFVDEVILTSIGFTTNTLFQQVRNWAAGSQLDQSTLREACSAVIMNLVGRSLVVTTDVLMNKALEEMSGALRDASAALNQPRGVVDKLASLVPALDRTTIHDAVEEIFDIAADVFKPLPAEKRARIRELLYRIIDTMPAGSGADLQTQLKNDAFIPNSEAAIELALELGALIRDNFVALVTRLLELIGEAILELITAAIEFIEEQIRQWIDGLQTLLDEAVAALLELDAAIDALERQVSASAGLVLDGTQAFLGALASPNRRSGMRNQGKAVVRDACIAVLEGMPLYSCLPGAGRSLVRSSLDDAIAALVDDELVDDLGDAIGAVAGGIDDFIEDARNIDPDDDVAGALVDLLVDRVEDAIRDAFGGSIRIEFIFRVRGHYYGPSIDTPLGSYRPSIEIDQRFDLGEVRIDVDDVVRVIRSWARGLQVVTGAAHDLSDRLRELVDLERLLEEHELAAEDTRARRDRAERQKRETTSAGAELRIVHPGPGGAYPGAVPVEVAIKGVPTGFLGRDPDEQARLYVFLNDVPIDVARFQVQEAIPPSSIEIRVPSFRGGTGLESVELRDGSVPVHGTRASTALERATSVARIAHPSVARTIGARAGRQPAGWSSSPRRDAAVSASTPEARRAQRGRTSGVGTTTSAAPFMPGARPLDSAVTPGRKPRISVTDRLVEATHPDLVLRTTLDPKELKDGFNTVTVVITTGEAARRVTETVVFHASPVSKAKIPGRPRSAGGALRARLTVASDLLSPALAEVAARGGARRGTRGPALSAGNMPVRSVRSVPRPAGDKKAASEAVRERVRPQGEAPAARLAQSRERIGQYRAAVKTREHERAPTPDKPKTRKTAASHPDHDGKDFS